MINLTNELSIIQVSGDDATNFLQGQLTNDITKLDKTSYQISAHLNNKGRMLASFIITKSEDNGYYLITTKDISSKIIPRLKMFVLRAKVTINELSDINIIFSTNDASQQESITPLVTFTNTPQNDWQPKLVADNYVLSITKENIASLSTDNFAWKQFLITNKIPLIYLKTQELFIPQQVSLDEINGVNFKKGCYIGQEIVARTHYLGKIKRRLYQFKTTNQVQIGQDIYSPTMNNQSIGHIVDATTSSDGKIIGLASLQTNCIESAFLDIANNHPLSI